MAESRLQRVRQHLASCWALRPALRSLLPQAGRGSRLAPLDGARALCMLWVIWYHAMIGPMPEPADVDQELAHPSNPPSLVTRFFSSWLAQPVLNGGQGVDVFFAISGFLIAHIWISEVSKTGGFRYGRFLVRRLLRIWPMLALALGIMALGSRIVAASDPTAAISADTCARDWWKVLLLVNDVLRTECLGMSWTVATEWHLYIVSPLIMWAAYCPRRAAPRRFGLAGLAAATLVQPAIMGVLGATGSDPEHWFKLPYSLPITRCAPYLAGMFASVCFDQFRRAQQLPTAAPATAAKPGAPAGALAVEGSSDSLSAKEQASSCGSLESGQPCSSEGDAAVSLGCCSTLAAVLAAVNWRRALRVAVDLAAVATILALLFIGVGFNEFIEVQFPALDSALDVMGRWLFGWAVARVFAATLQGRLCAINAFLSGGFWTPIAALSYSAYLLQTPPLAVLPSWAAANVTTIWAAWGTGLLGCVVASAAALLIALPCYLLVERPCSLLWPRNF